MSGIIESTSRRRIGYTVWMLVCLFFLAFFIGPFFWMFFTSFKARPDIVRFPPRLLPAQWITENYATMWNELPWLPMFWNSTWITVLSVLLVIFFNSLAGFSFAKLNWPFRNFFFLFIIAGLIVPEQVDMIPRFLMMVSWGLTGTFVPIILFMVAQGFQTFMLRQFISTIPNEYIDAAKIDGMGYFGIFVRIIMPLARAGILTMTIFTTFAVWNQYVYPLIYLTHPHQFTVQLGLGLLQQRLAGQFGPIMAGATIVSIPTMIVYLIFQRYFTAGITMAGIKG